MNKETGAAIEKSRRLREDMMSLRDKVSLGQFEERKYYLYSLSEMEKICEGIGSASDRDEFLSELKKYVDLFSPEEGTFRDYYFLCLTTLLYNTRDIRYVDMLCKEIHHPLYGPHAGLFIYNQIKRLYLTNVLHGYSKAYHDLYNEVVMAWSDVLSDAITPIPSNERNRERIAVVMLHFLNKTVAPTKSALERIKTLQDMGKDVLCIHSREQYTSVGLLPFYGMVKGTYEADFDGFNKVDLDGFQFPMYQPPVEMPDYNEYLKILAMIREYAPYEVIILGDNCILGELCAQMIPSICIPMVFSGIPHKRIRQYVAIGRHINDEELLAAKEDGCLAEQFIESTFTFKLRDQETKLKREDLNIPTDRFVLSIVGIRLDHDVSDDFLEKLLSIAENGFHIVFAGIFEKEYKDKFEEAGIEFFYTLIDDAISRVMRSNGGFIWALKNYDGDVMSDMIATAFGALAMMTSVLVSPDGNYEFEAAHGTVQRHYYKHLKGEETSTNSIATIFAWTGALRKRGQMDKIDGLVSWADRMEKAVIDTIEAGFMTKDLAQITVIENPKVLNTEEFISAGNLLRGGAGHEQRERAVGRRRWRRKIQ